MAFSDRRAVPAGFWMLAGPLFAVAALLSWVGLHTTGMAVFPIPVALYIGLGKPGRAAVLLALAGAAPLMAAQLAPEGAHLAVRFLLTAGIGVPLGIGLLRRWAYGWALAATTAYAVVVLGATLALHHEAWRMGADAALVVLEDAVDQQFRPTNPDAALRLRLGVAWMRRHWTSLGYGLAFAQIVLIAAVFQWGAVWLLKSRDPDAGPPDGFRTLRVPEWLVWAVIGCAALWFWDHYQDVPWARHASWNGLIGLSSLYWLNGLAVATYVARVWRPGPLMVLLIAVFVLLAMSAAHTMLIMFGLFDTWGEFRQKADRIAEARKNSGPGGNDRR